MKFANFLYIHSLLSLIAYYHCLHTLRTAVPLKLALLRQKGKSKQLIRPTFFIRNIQLLYGYCYQKVMDFSKNLTPGYDSLPTPEDQCIMYYCNIIIIITIAIITFGCRLSYPGVKFIEKSMAKFLLGLCIGRPTLLKY
jgi:hypothetical protein